MSVFRRAMVYLGLVDEELDYDDMGVDPVDPGFEPVASTPAPAPLRSQESEGVRALPNRDHTGTVTPISAQPATSGSVRPRPSSRPRIVVPMDFKDAQEVGDRYRENQPVIVNLQDADDGLRRRLIDFCSGLTYALEGNMERVAKNVFMLTPANVEVSAEARRRLQEDGFVSR
jgi:cell division inhibitor SepF